MLSKKLRKAFDDVDKSDPNSISRRTLYRLFIDISIALTSMREKRGLSQRDLAKKLNTSHPTIVRWETAGYTGYTLSKLVEVSDILGYEIDIKFIPKELRNTQTEISYTNADSWEGDMNSKMLQNEQLTMHQGTKWGVTIKGVNL